MPTTGNADADPGRITGHACLLYALQRPVPESGREAAAVVRLAERLELPICVLLVVTENPKALRGKWLIDRISLEPTLAEQLAKAWAALELLRSRVRFPVSTCFDVEFATDYALCVRKRASLHGCKLVVTADHWLRGTDVETRALLDSDEFPVVSMPLTRTGGQKA
ncbi:MAG: hypothetical protein H6832_00900 [Planctomycetes bacterium]|nr:hypothetical protein [Planctomycetota bacterium]MCB9916941.1 hypothetical protein [Planctomycetota bacterium]